MRKIANVVPAVGGVAARMRHAALVVALLAVVAEAEAVCLPRPHAVGSDPAYGYAAAFIDALAYGKQAGQRLTDGSTNESVPASLTRTLTNLQRVAKDFGCAASIMADQENYADDESSEFGTKAAQVARDTASVTKSAYLELAAAARSYGTLIEEILAGDVHMATMPSAVAKVLSTADDQWRTIFYVSPAVAHILVDPKPDAAGRLSRLRITTAERRDLIQRLDTAFGAAARKESHR